MRISQILSRMLMSMFHPRFPDDPTERRRMQAFILGSTAGVALRPNTDGKILIEIEQGDTPKGEQCDG